jgi:septation ring formation regulator EzrA
MSLWTPSGEHPVDRPGQSASEPSPPPSPPPSAGPTEEELENLSPEEREQLEAMARQVEDARRQLLQAPAGPVVGQQALQFYELAALHLSQPEPKLDDARIAIDALTAVVEAVGARLGEAENPLRQAVHQLQVGFVEALRSAESEFAPEES